MEWTSLNDLREKYLSFFESKGHLRLPSFPLIPQNDKSLLLINSGMAPMKKYFTGEVTPPRSRVTTCQKCIRTPDIDRVGKTARHGTYFEMLGNFSFGDYFKHEATAWAWEFCTKVLELPTDKLWVTIYLDDDEAFDIWTKEVGVSADHIVRLGKEDNFWEHGSGPCGPCSEIYFDRGEKYGCGSPTCGVGCDCDRYTEFWNIVFSQFDSDGKGNYGKLEHPNIDTGMGLERLACILQGVDNLFEVDTVQNIMKHVARIAGVKYHKNEKNDVSLRVITDHIRSTVFMIGDGVMPSNEGRGYVLRRLLRRAARHGRLLGIERPFLAEVCETVIKENACAYPNLVEKQDYIKKIIQIEEDSFSKTIDTGLQLLNQLIENASSKKIGGEEAFKLYDTFGFPIDLTKEILAEKGFETDEAVFDKLMHEQRQRARNARKNAGADAWEGSKSLVDEMQKTNFVGYEEMKTADSKVMAIIKDGELVESLESGESGIIILDKTPFYGEGGGQVGDIGAISDDESVFEVKDTTKTAEGVFMHHGKLGKGSVRVGDRVAAGINVGYRNAVMRNHTAAHLLQAALRKVLGTHVEQAGQLVNSRGVRFDFTHFAAMTSEELEKVEKEVNDVILSAEKVTTTEMPIDEAKKLGAMALFGEKYGSVVRVVRAGDFSIEFCGGTHVDNTGKLGLFKIISESSVAAGVRRIQGITGYNVLEYLDGNIELINKTAEVMKVGDVHELEHRAQQLVNENKAKDKELEKFSAKMASAKIEKLLAGAKDIYGVKILTAVFGDTPADSLRSMCDTAKDYSADIVAVFAGVSKESGKVSFAAVCGKNAVGKGAHAGNIVREVAKIAGGSGGGRPDSAMAGGKDISKVNDALKAVDDIVLKMLK